MQLSTPEVIGGAIVAIEGVLSFLSGILPKASEEETFVNNVLNLIHGAGFNSDKVVLPKKKQSKVDIANLLTDIVSDVVPMVEKILEDKDNTAEQSITTTPVSPPSASINPMPPVHTATLAPMPHK